MTLSEEAAREDRPKKSRARVLFLDIETQRAIVETWNTFKPFIGIDNIVVDARVLCFAAKWRGAKRVIFRAAWEENDEHIVDPAQYESMMRCVFDLMDEADILVSYNGDRFDWQWLQREFSRLGLGRPLPAKSIDLMKINKRWFHAGQLSLKLDWSLRKWFHDRKVSHGGVDLWRDIRWGTVKERLSARKTMREYNIGDTVKTERLFESWLPWAPINLALYENDDDDGVLHCTKCNSTNLEAVSRKRHRTNAFSYQLYRCKDCTAPSKGKRGKGTTELRPL